MDDVPEERRKGGRREEDVVDNEKKETAATLRASLRRLALATVVLYIALGGLALKSYLDGRRTNSVLCTYRTDLTARVIASTKYLQEHPNGAPGIPAKTIIDGIANQQRAIVAFKDLNCPTGTSEALEAAPTPP